MTYSREMLSPADLQLGDARSGDATEIARLFNVPVAMVSASPSGGAHAMLYANLSTTLAILVSDAVAPHLRTIEDTLSDVAYPLGQSVAFDVQTFLRSDPSAAADYAIALYQASITTLEETRAFLGIPAAIDAPDLSPGKV
jgi:phage portal protein BeeE